MNNFDFTILDTVEENEDLLREVEAQWIIAKNTLSPNGYNQTLDTLHPRNDPATYAKMKNTKREQARNLAEIDIDNKILHTWRSIIDCAEETGLDERKIASCCRGERRSTQNRYFCWLNDNGSLDIPEYCRDSYKDKAGTT
jgi:hypothetical protein